MTIDTIPISPHSECRKSTPTLDAAPRISILGAAPDTGNLGVSALCYATLEGIHQRLPNAQITIFDHGRGSRRGSIESEGGSVDIGYCGIEHSRHLYRRQNLTRMLACSRLGLVDGTPLSTIAQADAVLDVSGGDSFTDLYGKWRFDAVTLPKRVALASHRRLTLLPQTYGPFRNDRSRRRAQSIVRRAHSAWARDLHSFRALEAMLGDDFDPARHRHGVDVAFLLRAVSNPACEDAWRQLERFSPRIGVNISGLIFNDAVAASKRFGFRASYRDGVVELVTRLLESTDAGVLLVPHVIPPEDYHSAWAESDLVACQRLHEQLAGRFGERIAVAPVTRDPRHIKWLISQLDWFCGTRMHSTIAALSSCVACATISYSGKTLGVFESCGQGGHVADPLELDTTEVLEVLWRSFEQRRDAHASLEAHLPEVIETARGQMDAIAIESASRHIDEPSSTLC